MPAVVPVKTAADQVKTRMIAGEPGGFDIKKEDLLPISNPLQRIGIREGQGFLYGNHVRTPFTEKDYGMIIAGRKQEVNKK